MGQIHKMRTTVMMSATTGPCKHLCCHELLHVRHLFDNEGMFDHPEFAAACLVLHVVMVRMMRVQGDSTSFSIPNR